MSDVLTKNLNKMTAEMEGRPDGDPIPYLTELATFGKGVFDKHLSDATARTITDYIIHSLAKSRGVAAPGGSGVMIVAASENDIRSLVYTALLTGVALAVNEEIR